MKRDEEALHQVDTDILEKKNRHKKHFEKPFNIERDHQDKKMYDHLHTIANFAFSFSN
jgi:hypothetical protein